jgi:hypothetical protein
MGTPRFEPVTGTVDGVNKLFRTFVPYTAGTLAVFLNGQLLKQEHNDGWVENDPWRGYFSYKIAPLTGDVPQVFYLALEGTEGTQEQISRVIVTLEEVDNAVGYFQDSGKLVVQSVEGESVQAHFLPAAQVLGKIEETAQIQATLVPCG